MPHYPSISHLRLLRSVYTLLSGLPRNWFDSRENDQGWSFNRIEYPLLLPVGHLHCQKNKIIPYILISCVGYIYKRKVISWFWKSHGMKLEERQELGGH
jgi:hypothetical protein